MGSNYKKLGPYIQIVNERNSSLSGHKLLGVSIRKCFMPSIANIIGTDMSTYKLIRKKQFAYGPVTSRNGDKISVALLEDLEKAIVSQAYTVFEIKDFNELDPEYLMMWFRRPEFDRYARFKSHGSAREIFDWVEMNETELPIPSIEKQLEIVREYNTVVNRIKLNEQLNQKLEETAQAIYKQWFVDFEFPDENGKPYKTSGGKMVWRDELEKEIPKGWQVGTLELLGEIVGGATPSTDNLEYWTSSQDGISWISPKDLTKNRYKFIYEGENYISKLGYSKASTKLLPENSVLFSSRAPIGILGIVKKELCTNQGFKSIVPHDIVCYHYVYYFLQFNSDDIANQGTGSTFDEVSGSMMKAYPAYLPAEGLMRDFAGILDKLFIHQINIEKELRLATNMKSILLSKMTKIEEIIENY